MYSLQASSSRLVEMHITYSSTAALLRLLSLSAEKGASRPLTSRVSTATRTTFCAKA